MLDKALRWVAEPVHNIEVEGDHCYRVGEQGLLVHNASVPLFNTDPKAYKAAAEFFENLKKQPDNTVDCYCAGGTLVQL